MAAITSQLFSQQMIEEALKQSNKDTAAISRTELSDASTADATSTADQQSVLTEIQAIQAAILEEDFDFTQLEATAAGNQEAGANNLVSTEKTQASPILLEDEGLLIQFRSTDSFNSNQDDDQNITSSISDPETSNLDTFDELNADENLNNSSEVIAANQINSFVSEDFVTQTQGNFDAELAIPAQTIETQYGTFNSSQDGTWTYQLNNAAPEIQSLSAGQILNDSLRLSASNGEAVELNIAIQGNNDQAIITGQKTASIQAQATAELGADLPVISGKLNVSDIDNGEASFSANAKLSGNFGSAEINALGEWHYTLNNHSDAVQGLRSGEKLFDLFSVKTLDGSKQLIQITIQGADDQPLLGGNNLGILDLETQLGSSGSLTINDPDFGESFFQEETDIQSSLGYGSGSINAQGEWQFSLDIDFTLANPINEGQTRVDSFEVLTADGTSQTINIPIQGSDQPLYAQANEASALQFEELMTDTETLDTLNLNQHSQNLTSQAPTEAHVESILSTHYSNDATAQISQAHLNDIGLI